MVRREKAVLARLQEHLPEAYYEFPGYIVPIARHARFTILGIGGALAVAVEEVIHGEDLADGGDAPTARLILSLIPAAQQRVALYRLTGVI